MSHLQHEHYLETCAEAALEPTESHKTVEQGLYYEIFTQGESDENIARMWRGEGNCHASDIALAYLQSLRENDTRLFDWFRATTGANYSGTPSELNAAVQSGLTYMLKRDSWDMDRLKPTLWSEHQILDWTAFDAYDHGLRNGCGVSMNEFLAALAALREEEGS